MHLPEPLHGSLPPLQDNKFFASFKLVDDYLSKGRLPKIHDDMGHAMEWVPEAERTGALDLGACHGLLSVRARKLGWKKIIGVELDHPSVDVFDSFIKPTVTDVEIIRMGINVFDGAFFPWMKSMADKGLDTILARRIFCEIFVDSFPTKIGRDPEHLKEAGRLFGLAARRAGFKRIILEGRIWKGYLKQKRHHPLYWVDREIDVLAPLWRCIHRYNDCAILLPHEQVPNPLHTTRHPIEKDEA